MLPHDAPMGRLSFQTVADFPIATNSSMRSSITQASTLDAVRSLTPRQREVLAVMMEGKCNKGICRALNLAEPTVKNHVTAILKALNATNRTEAVIKVARASAAPASYIYTITGYSKSLWR
jgi:DNA-binding NarL/FixJ family response regulator